MKTWTLLIDINRELPFSHKIPEANAEESFDFSWNSLVIITW